MKELILTPCFKEAATLLLGFPMLRLIAEASQYALGKLHCSSFLMLEGAMIEVHKNGDTPSGSVPAGSSISPTVQGGIELSLATLPIPLKEQRAEIVRAKAEAQGLEPSATERQIGLETELVAFCRSVLPNLDKNLKNLVNPDSNPQGVVTLGEVHLSDIESFQGSLKVLDIGSLKLMVRLALASIGMKREGETVLSPTSSSLSLNALKEAVESQGVSLSYGLEYRRYRAGDNPIWFLRIYAEV